MFLRERLATRAHVANMLPLVVWPPALLPVNVRQHVQTWSGHSIPPMARGRIASKRCSGEHVSRLMLLRSATPSAKALFERSAAGKACPSYHQVDSVRHSAISYLVRTCKVPWVRFDRGRAASPTRPRTTPSGILVHRPVCCHLLRIYPFVEEGANFTAHALCLSQSTTFSAQAESVLRRNKGRLHAFRFGLVGVLGLLCIVVLSGALWISRAVSQAQSAVRGGRRL